jgi:hypothetical protein
MSTGPAEFDLAPIPQEDGAITAAFSEVDARLAAYAQGVGQLHDRARSLEVRQTSLAERLLQHTLRLGELLRDLRQGIRGEVGDTADSNATDVDSLEQAGATPPAGATDNETAAESPVSDDEEAASVEEAEAPLNDEQVAERRERLQRRLGG